MKILSLQITDNTMIKYAIELMVKDNKLNWVEALKKAKKNYETFFDRIVDRIQSDKICGHNNTIDMIANNIYDIINKY